MINSVILIAAFCAGVILGAIGAVMLSCAIWWDAPCAKKRAARDEHETMANSK